MDDFERDSEVQTSYRRLDAIFVGVSAAIFRAAAATKLRMLQIQDYTTELVVFSFFRDLNYYRTDPARMISHALSRCVPLLLIPSRICSLALA